MNSNVYLQVAASLHGSIRRALLRNGDTRGARAWQEPAGTADACHRGMRTSKHPVTVLLLFAGIAVATAITIIAGFWLDAHRAIGSSGIVAFLVTAVTVFVGVEILAGTAGEELDRRLHRA
jgi:hypothetical protein